MSEDMRLEIQSISFDYELLDKRVTRASNLNNLSLAKAILLKKMWKRKFFNPVYHF